MIISRKYQKRENYNEGKQNEKSYGRTENKEQ